MLMNHLNKRVDGKGTCSETNLKSWLMEKEYFDEPAEYEDG